MSIKQNKISIKELINKQENNPVNKIKEELSKELIKPVETKKIELKSNTTLDNFLHGDLKTSINKVLSVRLTKEQNDIIKSVAKANNMEIKELLLNLVAEKAKDLKII